MSWLEEAVMQPCDKHLQLAKNRQQQLTKPAGSLGALETAAITLASLQQTPTPSVDNIYISIFAADHGIAAENVSAFPQAVTAEMIRNFAGVKGQQGGAAIAVLARQLKANLRVVNLGTVSELEEIPGVENISIAPGTANFSKQAAMTEEQLEKALNTGKQHIEDAKEAQSDIFIGGEMGIANTSSATALACRLLNLSAAELTGPGTGLSLEAQAHKQKVIESSLTLHNSISEPLEVLRYFGGFEIAALTGAYIRGAQIGVPIIVDGFISSVAALVAYKHHPDIKKWLILGHQSAEPGHQRIIDSLGLTPLLRLDMRLGEASGAACAVPLLQLACKLHNDMATFESANVSTKSS